MRRFALPGKHCSVLVLGVLLLVMAACAKSTPTATSAAPGQPGTSTGGDPLAQFKTSLDRWYKGTYHDMPTSGPKAQAGKNVWVISCGQASEGCQIPGDAAKEAGEAIGWKMTVFDAKLDPSQFSTGIRQAVAAKADGIILDVIDCALTQQALQEAKAAGVKLIGMHSLDCDDPSVGGKALWDGQLSSGIEFPDYRALLLAFGATKADWVINQTQGKAKVIEFREDELLVVKYINDGFDAEIKKCAGCAIVETVNFVLADLGPPLQQKAQGALLKHPEANSVIIPYDSAVTLGIGQAIEESGRKSQLKVMGGEGFLSNIQNARDGKQQDAGTGYGFIWDGWASVDGMNRLLQGQKVVDSGNGFAVWDKDHNFPAAGQTYLPPTDFKTQYKKIWAGTG